MSRPIRSRHFATAIAALSAAFSVSGCRAADTGAHAARGGHGDIGGTLVVALPADVATLLPPYAVGTQEQLAVDLMFDRLAIPGDSINTIGDMGFGPRLAERWDWGRDSLSIAFHLNPDARWHDGVPVRAHDVQFTYRLYSNPAAGVESASQIQSIDSVSTPDSLTAVFWFKRRYPEQFFDATYQLIICPAHLLEQVPVADLRSSPFAHQPIGDGRFRFVRATPGSSIEYMADTGNYLGRAKVDRLILSVTANPGAALTKLLAGDADMYSAVPMTSAAELERQGDLAMRLYDDLSYGFLWFNLRVGPSARPHPIFGDRAVRRALAMAVDRTKIVRNVWDSLGTVINGPFASPTSSADYTIAAIPYDTVRANQLLDSAGWRKGADGVRQKGGHPLSFSILVPTSSKTRQQMALLIQDQLSHVGAKVTVDAIELRAMITRFQSHDFDAGLQIWHTDGAMNDLRQTWSSAGVKDGLNWGSYESPEFDRILDSALVATDAAKTHALLHRAYTVINDDVPAVWLYQPRQILGVHRRIHVTTLAPFAWYAHIADWSIPADSRIPRDNIGLASVPR